MKKLITALFVLAVFVCPTFGQEATDSLSTKSLLWEISGNDLDSASFIFGTVHLIPKEHFILTDVTQDALKKTDQLVLELDLEEISGLEMLGPLFFRSIMWDGTRLDSLVGEEDFELLKETFSELSLPIQETPLFNKLKPMALYMLLEALTYSQAIEEGDTEEQLSYETELLKIAQGEEMEVAGIETVDDQLSSLFDSIPYDVQAEMLIETIKAEEAIAEGESNNLIQLYKDQDIQGLYDTIHGDSEGISTFENAMLVTRNRNWIPIMAKMMKESPTFFAVGAGHLGGSIGVLALLQKAGYTLRPIR